MFTEPRHIGEKTEHGKEGKGKAVVYILSDYPSLSTTFIDREILEAKRRGLNLEIVSIGRPKNLSLSKAVQDLVTEITYILPVSVVRLAQTNLLALLRDSRTYLSTLLFVATREHNSLGRRIKSLWHFCLGVQAAELLREGPVVRHLHAHFADRAAVVAMVASRLLDVPYSVTAHAYEIYREPVFLGDKIRGAKFATTCTAFNQVHLESETGAKVELIYHGLDFSDLGPARTEHQDHTTKPTILSVGRLEDKKGFEFLIRACGVLRHRGYRFSCEIVGDGSSRARLQSLIAAEGLGDIVRLCGPLPNSEVFHKYRAASMFVLPSCITKEGDRDGIPNVILEAMACGLPVVSTHISGIPEVVEHGYTGLLVPPNDVELLSNAIAQLLDSERLAKRMGKEASTSVRKKFDIRVNVVRLVELLREKEDEA